MRWVIDDVCALSAVEPCRLAYTNPETVDGEAWRVSSSFDESSSIVSSRFVDSPRATRWKGFDSIIYLILKEGRAPLSSTRYIIRESTFANLLPPEDTEGGDPAWKRLRALCLWFHNFRRRDVRRSGGEREREKRSEFNIASKTSFEEGRVCMNGDGWTLDTLNVESIFNPLSKIREEE